MSATSENSTGGNTSTGSTKTFVTALVTSAIILGVQAAVFLYFHKKQRKVYEPRTFLLQDEKKRPKELPSNPLKWMTAIWNIHIDEVRYQNGYDAYFFVRILRMYFCIFIPFAFLTCAILMPVSAVAPNKGQTGLSMFVIGNVGLTVQARLGAHLAVAWVLTFFVFWMVWKECKHFVEQRKAYLASPEYQSQARARTVLVTKVPSEKMNEAFLREYASEYGTVERLWLVRDVSKVDDVYDDRQDACTKLEKAEGKLIQLANKRVRKGKAQMPSADHKVNMPADGTTTEEAQAQAETGDVDAINSLVPAKKRPSHRLGKLGFLFIGKKVDTIKHSTAEINRTEEELKAMRANPENYKLASSAIIRFATHEAAVAFTDAAGKASKVVGSMPRFNDISPEDIYWRNLGLNAKILPGRIALGWGLTIGLILIWAVPVAFVGGLSNLSGLCDSVSWLAWVCTLPSPVTGIIQGAAPPIGLAILFMLLPIVLRVFAKIEGKPTHTLLDRAVMSKYWLFLIIHGFLIVTISSSLASGLADAIQNPQEAPSILATKLPQSSIFFLTFVVTSSFSAAASYLCQVVPIALQVAMRILGGATPRKIWKLERTMKSVSYFQLLPNVSLLAVLGLVYSVIQPIMSLVALLAFFIYLLAFKYMFVYVFDQPEEFETGGSYFKKAIGHLFVGLYIMELCLCGLFFLSTNDSGGRSAIPEGALMAALIAITVAFQVFLRIHFRLEHVKIESNSTSTNGLKNSYTPDKMGDQATAHENDYEAVKDKHGFEPPSMWTKQPVIWIAKDELGLADREAKKIHDSGIAVSTELTSTDKKGNIEVHGDPDFIYDP